MVALPAISTTAASLSRNFGLWQDRAMAEPVLVTHHGRPRAVLVSADDYSRLGSGETCDHPDHHIVNTSVIDDVIFDHIVQGFVALDADFTVMRANRAAAQYFQRSADKLSGLKLTDLYPALHESMKTKIFQRVMRTGEEIGFEVPSSMYPGQHIRIHAFPYEGGVAYLFQTIVDEELKKQAAEHEALKALFAAHGTAGMARLSVRGTFTDIDPSLLTMIGFTSEDLQSARLIDIVPIARRVELRNVLEKVLNGEGAIALTTELMHRTGRELPVTIALSEVRESFTIDGVALLVTPRAG